MITALTGDMAKVSGSRIAMPLAPPSPGSTPMRTPSTMPTSISQHIRRLSATAKPCISSPIFPWRSVAERGFDRTLGQRHQEPDLEHHEGHPRGGEARAARRGRPPNPPSRNMNQATSTADGA